MQGKIARKEQMNADDGGEDVPISGLEQHTTLLLGDPKVFERHFTECSTAVLV